MFDHPVTTERPKRKKKPNPQVFKPYPQHQTMLLPPSLEDAIPERHIVRVINTVIDQLSLDQLYASYKGSGTSAFDPRMMLKVIVYAYVMGIYTSRYIAKGLREDLHFMWLAAMQRPDFRTINDFRSKRLKDLIDLIFVEVILFLAEHKYISLDNYFVDGTVIAANANKHSYVWKNNTKRYKAKTLKKIHALLQQIEDANRIENETYGNRDLEELGNDTTLTSDALKTQIDALNARLHSAPPSITNAGPSPENAQGAASAPPGDAEARRKCKALKELASTHLVKLQKYEEQERLLAGRNSYSKTDTDATFFRTKAGELRPAYTFMVGTENQFVLNYSIHQKPSETDQFLGHFTKFTRGLGCTPRSVIGDAAYGSEENYEFLEQHNVAAYLKYNTYHKDLAPHKKSPYHKDNFPHDAATDAYRCPEGRTLLFHDVGTRTTATGYQQRYRQYQCADCTGCPVAALCKRGDGPRSIQIAPLWDHHRAAVRARLASAAGATLYKRRCTEPETAFGDIKWNNGFTRFLLRGKEKVNVETGLVCLARNMKRLFSVMN
jgi:transposase